MPLQQTFSFFLFPLVLAEKFKSHVCPRSVRRNADFRFLDTNSLILIGFWYALRWYLLRFPLIEK